jgi:hypothetical protein
LRGKSCWAAIAGRGTGSAIDLHFGSKVPRERPLSNPTLTEEERRFEGEVSIYITCAWRLDSKSSVVSGWLDGGETVDEMVKGLKSIVGHRAEAVEIQKPAWDLKIKFDNDLTLMVFADQTNVLDRDDNYSVFVGTKGFTVGTRGELRWEVPDLVLGTPDADGGA